MKYTDRNIRCIVNLEPIKYEQALYYSGSGNDKFVIVDAYKTLQERSFNIDDNSFAVEIVNNNKIIESDNFLFCHRMDVYVRAGLTVEYFVFNNSTHTREAYEALRCQLELSQYMTDEHKFCSYNYQLLHKVPMWIRRIFKAV